MSTVGWVERSETQQFGIPPCWVSRFALHPTIRRWRGAVSLRRTGTIFDSGPDLKQGKISQFSLDLLVRLAARAGLHPKLKLAA